MRKNAIPTGENHAKGLTVLKVSSVTESRRKQLLCIFNKKKKNVEIQRMGYINVFQREYIGSGGEFVYADQEYIIAFSPFLHFSICFPAQNQAASPIIPIVEAARFNAMRPQTANPPIPIATKTKMAAIRSACPISSIGLSLLYLCPLSPSNYRGESSFFSLYSLVHPHNDRFYHSLEHPTKIAEAQSIGVNAHFSSFSPHGYYAFTVTKKQLMPAPYTSMCSPIHRLKDAIALAVFSVMMGLFYKKVNAIRLYKVFPFLMEGYLFNDGLFY